jgi:hypothetical protein
MEKSKADLQDILKDNATKRLKEKSKTESVSSDSFSTQPPKKRKKAVASDDFVDFCMSNDKKTTALLEDFVELQRQLVTKTEEQCEIDRINAEARLLEAQNNSKTQSNFEKLIVKLFQTK